MYADYEFYTDQYYGDTISSEDFPRLSSRASDFLDYYTRGKAAKVTDEDTTTALAKACCAVAEAMKADEDNKKLAQKAAEAALSETGGEVKSETVGSHSVSYTTAADYIKGSSSGRPLGARIAYADVAMVYLVNTGLLYRGEC